jgi:hypothetical protein
VVKITYTLEDTKISEHDAAALYEDIYRALQKKIHGLRDTSARSDTFSEESRYRPAKGQQIQSKSKIYESDVITPELDREIIRENMIEQSISKTRYYFKGIHGMGRHITTMPSEISSGEF